MDLSLNLERRQSNIPLTTTTVTTVKKVKIPGPNKEFDPLTRQTPAAESTVVIPKDLTVINGLCVGNEDTSDDDAPRTLKQQTAKAAYLLDPKGNKRYRDPQTGIWDTPLTRSHARMSAELRGANQEGANSPRLSPWIWRIQESATPLTLLSKDYQLLPQSHHKILRALRIRLSPRTRPRTRVSLARTGHTATPLSLGSLP